MDDDVKRAAKAFVEQYFPVKEPKTGDVFGDLFQLNQEPPKRQQGSTAQTATADGKFLGTSNNIQSMPQKATTPAEISEPCLMSSSVDYGCRDNYPYNPDNRYPSPYYYIDKKDGKEGGSENKSTEISTAEWWQGSLYY